MIERRAFITAAMGCALTPVVAKASDWGNFVETQQGDPLIASESIELDAEKIQKLMRGMATYRDRITNQDFASRLATAADPMIGWSRATTPEKVADMLGVYDLPFKSGSKYVPFCAAGVSYLVAAAYLKFWNLPVNTTTVRGALEEIDRYHFYPSPSVMEMYFVARGKRRWIDADPAKVLPKAGWLVIYDWTGTNRGADHVGLVTGYSAKGIETIEFNTSHQNQRDGGQVARRLRPYNKFVRGFVRTNIATPI